MVLAQGDTSTVFATALTAFYRQIPFGHVEAGLRTGNLRSPFPEEANRMLTTPLTTLHFAPTAAAAENLRRERIDEKRIIVTGNTVIDALFMELARQRQPEVQQQLAARLREQIGPDYGERPFVLITGHRRENFGAGFDQICDALATLAARFPDHLFIYPVHFNPNVQTVVNRRLGAIENIRLIAPQPYSEFVALLAACRLALTDSGGVQEEAPSLGKPVLVMRDTTSAPKASPPARPNLSAPMRSPSSPKSLFCSKTPPRTAQCPKPSTPTATATPPSAFSSRSKTSFPHKAASASRAHCHRPRGP